MPECPHCGRCTEAPIEPRTKETNMTQHELEIAISVEITKINAIDHEGSIASEMSALARVDALEWVLGMIKKPDRKDKEDKEDEEMYKLRIHF